MRRKRSAACPCCDAAGTLCVQVLNPCFTILSAVPFGGPGGVTVEVRDSGAALVATGVTGTDGRACFAGLPAGDYTATALAPTARWVDTSTAATVGADRATSARAVMRAAAGYRYAAFCDRPLPEALTITTVWGTAAFVYTESVAEAPGDAFPATGWFARLDVEADASRPGPYGPCTQQRASTQADVVLNPCGGLTVRFPRALCCVDGTLVSSTAESSPPNTLCDSTAAPAWPGLPTGPGTGYALDSNPGGSPPPAGSCDPFVARVYRAGYTSRLPGGEDYALWDDGLGNTIPYLTISE